MATQPDSDDETATAVAIFQSAVYGNDSLLLRRLSQTQPQNPPITAEIQNKARDTDDENESVSASEHDIDQAPESGPDLDMDIQDEKEILRQDHNDNDSDSDTNDDQNTNNNNNPNAPNGRVRIDWGDADDDFKQQFFQLLIQKMEQEHTQKIKHVEPEDLFKIGSIVDLSLAHSKYKCDAEILDILSHDEFKVKYIDPADKIEKITIVSREFLRAAEVDLNTENASKYEDEDAINNILLEGAATFDELEYLSVIIHPWVDRYFFKPYLPKGFMTFFMMTDNDINIDTVIQTRDGHKQYDYVSKYIALNILSYAGRESNMSHKLNCIWCGVDNILLNKTTTRTRLLLGGVSYDRHVTVLCDNCGFRFHRDDVIYSCQNDNHDVCIKCIWEKVKAFKSILDVLNEIDFYAVYQLNILPEIRNEIASFTCGKLLQFDK